MKLCEKHGVTFEPFRHPDEPEDEGRLDWVITVVFREEDKEITVYGDDGYRWDIYTRELLPRVYRGTAKMLRKEGNVCVS